MLTRLRAFGRVPVVVVSARDREGEKIAALDAGADDYVEKPFGIGELLARVRTALRHGRAQDGADEVIRAEGLEIDLVRRLVSVNGAAVTPSPRANTNSSPSSRAMPAGC